MNPIKIQELKEGWLVILATILQFLFGYPANILPISGILFAPKDEAFGASGTETAVTIGLFTVFMNLVSIFVGPLVKAKSPRFVAVLATKSGVWIDHLCIFWIYCYDYGWVWYFCWSWGWVVFSEQHHHYKEEFS